MILAVDIGTSFFKIALVDKCGNIIYKDKKLLETYVSGNIREQDPYSWINSWDELYKGIPSVYKNNVEGIVISGNGPTIIPVGRNGEPIGNGILWSDSRALVTSELLNSKLKKNIPPNFFLSKIFYLKELENKVYSLVDTFLSGPEFLCFYLTGNKYTLLPSQGFLPFYWTESDLDLLEIDKSRMAPYLEWSETYGLFNNIPVICAGPDFLMSILGCGAIAEGSICDRTGTSEGINYNSRVNYSIPGFRTLPHIVDSLYTIAGLIPDSGELVKKGDLETLVLRYKDIISKLIDSGCHVTDIRVIGGHSDMALLNRKKAECFNIPYKVFAPGAEMVGNGILGYYVLGVYPTIEEACKSMAKELL